jgi:hypothetical protein
MKLQKPSLVLLATFLAAGLAAAETKIVKTVHQDGFSAMGQETPARDHEQVLWLGEGRLRIDQEKSSSIIRTDLKKLFILHHDRKTYYEIDLPVSIEEMLPPEMAQHLMGMMKMDVSISPSDETRKVGPWEARRYDMTVSSAMMGMKTVIWASRDTGIESDEFQSMFGEMIKMQPGMHEVVAKMSIIEGFVVAQEGSMTMPMLGDTEVSSSETVTSIEQAPAPDGTYDLPAGYSLEEFDFAKMMQGR